MALDKRKLLFMKNTLQILNQGFIKYNKTEEKSLGLFDGNAGMAITSFILANNNNKKFLNIGFGLLNEISEKIASIKDTGYKDGLLGIAWTIEWLAQNNFLEVDTDEILEEVDDIVYKKVVYSLDTEISLFSGILGKLSYLIKRLSSMNSQTNRYRYICHQECIVILTDNLDTLLNGDNGIFTNLTAERILSIESEFIIELGNIIRVLTDIIRINDPTVQKVINDSVKFIELIFNKLFNDENIFLKLSSITFYNLFRLSINYYLAGIKIKKNIWENNGKKYISLFNNKNYLYINSNDVFSRLKIYALLNVYFPNSEYSAVIRKLIKDISPKKIDFKYYNGIGIFSLVELSINSPSLIKDWDELLFA
jgi:hypothetical protein